MGMERWERVADRGKLPVEDNACYFIHGTGYLGKNVKTHQTVPAKDCLPLPLGCPLLLLNVTVLRQTLHRCRTSAHTGQDRCPLSTLRGSSAFCEYENDTLTREQAAITLQNCKR